jgi:TonB family protein
MKTSWICVFVSLAFIGAPPAQESSEPVVTKLSLMVGTPDTAATEAAGTLLVSGTVIPVDAEAADPSTELRPSVPMDIGDKLKKALRLEHVVPRYSLLRPLAIEKRVELHRPTGDATIRIFATLLGFNTELVTYRIEFLDGTKILSDSNVSVQLGKRAVVGALDGDAAPYLFLVLEPEMIGPIPLQADTTNPRLLESVIPAYPKAAKEAKIQGLVIVRGVILTDGTVTDLKIERSDSPLLEKAALDAVSKNRYQPARDSEGNPIAVEYTTTLNFRLRN